MARGDIITSDNELQNNELLMNKGKERIEREKEELECKNREVTIATFSLNFERMILISCSSSLLIKLFTYSDFILKKLVYAHLSDFICVPLSSIFFFTF